MQGNSYSTWPTSRLLERYNMGLSCLALHDRKKSKYYAWSQVNHWLGRSKMSTSLMDSYYMQPHVGATFYDQKATITCLMYAFLRICTIYTKQDKVSEQPSHALFVVHCCRRSRVNKTNVNELSRPELH